MQKYIYALGFFDGVHRGHEALLERCRNLAQDANCGCGVVTFSNHPDTLVLGNTPRLLNTISDRERLLKERGMERILVLPFTKELRDTPWEEFLKHLRRDCGAAGFVCGDDFRFGARGEGTAQSLMDYCNRENLPGAVVSQCSVEGKRVSSSLIRSLLEQGDMERCVRFLGHPHILTGKVVSGKQLGRTLGIPTANLLLPPELAVPAFGVYACKVLVGDQSYMAVTNIGTRPTVSGQGITVESWLLDFFGDLYGKEITLEFHCFVRPETRFPSLDAMQAEIFRNAEFARKFFADKP